MIITFNNDIDYLLNKLIQLIIDGNFHDAIDRVTKFMVLIIQKPKEIKYKQGQYVYVIQHSSPIKVLGCIIYIILGANNVTAYPCAVNKETRRDGVIGSHAGLKILWTEVSVRVRFPFSLLIILIEMM